MFGLADQTWIEDHIVSGLSSGEGLIWAVRDAIEKRDPIKEKGRVKGYQTIITDPGIEDKRLLVFDAEFASTLRVMGRQGNVLSPVIRCAWDDGKLRMLTKNDPAKATGAHISIVAHVTKQELHRYLDHTEAANGFGNRFLWVCVCRSKALPDGGLVGEAEINSLAERLKIAIEFARTCGEVIKDQKARAIWHNVYAGLSEGKAGLFGSITGRAEAQVMRLASLYAVLDLSMVIREEHMLAALSFWQYCEDSCRHIFGESLGDPVADRILQALVTSPNGLTRTKISDLFGRNFNKDMITGALTLLHKSDLVGFETKPTAGRNSERWFASNVAYEKNEINEKRAP